MGGLLNNFRSKVFEYVKEDAFISQIVTFGNQKLENLYSILGYNILYE